MSQAVLIAIGIDWDGRRQILAVEMANRESRSSWKDFLVGLRQRGLNGVEFVRRSHRPSPPSAKCSPRPLSSAATCTSCATLWITCPARLMTIACRNCARSTIAVQSRRPARTLAAWIAKWGVRLSEARELGRENDRGDAHLL
jgi:putative transposase